MEERITSNNNDKIDLLVIFKKLADKRKLYAYTLSATFVFACIIILGYPRYYTTDIKLAPELNNSPSNMGALGSIASSFGIDLSEINSSDAITPLLYPNLMEDNKFICDLYDIPVANKDKSIKTTYYDYLQKYQNECIWLKPIAWVKNIFSSKKPESSENIDPYYLSKPNHDIAEKIRGDISIKVDKKTAIITIEATAQDPVICQTLADSIKSRLQNFITQYRTNKARVDYKYYKDLASTAKKEYEQTRQKYASMSDASTNVSLRSIELKLEDMENDMQLKFNTYSTLNTQLQAARAKVQERTPAFTVIKGAEVPVKPSGPKRMIFVATCLFMTFVATSMYILFKDAQLRTKDKH